MPLPLLPDDRPARRVAAARRHPPIPRVPRQLPGVVVVLLALTAIARATLGDGDPLALEPTGFLCLACGSHGGVDVVLNLLLFVPLGVGLRLTGVPGPAAVALGLLTSASVEAAQLLVFVGRAPTLSDLLTNTTGTVVGWGAVATWRAWLHPTPRLARRLAAAAALLWVAVLVTTALGLQRPTTDRFRVNTLPPDDAFVRPFEGAMREWSITGASAAADAGGDSAGHTVLRGTEAPRVHAAPAAPSASTALARALGAERLTLRASVHAMLPPGKLRPLVIVHDSAWRSLLVLGQQRRGLLLRVRTRSADLRFRSPEVVLPDAFPERIPRGDDPWRGPVVDVAGRVTAGELAVRAAGADGVRSLRMPRSPFLGWTMIAPQGVHYDRRGPLLTALWITGLLLPLGYWAVRAAASRPLGVAVATLAAVLPAMATARAAQLSLGGAAEWSALAVAILGGALLASVLHQDAAPRTGLARAPAACQHTLS